MCRVHTKPAMRLVPAMSSSMRWSGVAASRSPGSAASIAPRRYVPPCAPTNSSMPGRGGSASIETTRRSMSTTACMAASSTTSASRVRVVTRSRARPTRCSDVPMPAGHTMSRLDVRRADPGRRAGVPLCESSSGSGSGRGAATEVSVTGSPYRSCRERLPARRDTVPRMDDLFGPYQRTRARVSTLLLDATPDALTRTVPACPAWTVHDIAAHLVGVPATLAAGNFPDGDVNEWLQGIVDQRRDAEVDDLMQE